MWTIFKFIIIIFFIPINVFAQKIYLINPVGKKIPEVISISKNRSIMSCGERTGLSVYSSLDIQAILAISNMLSSESIALETNWDTYSPLKDSPTAGTLNEKEVLNFPKDVQRILFYCLSWEESYRLRLFNIPEDVLENITSSVVKQKPWNVLSENVVERINNFSEPTIRDFVYLILRADVFYSIRGGLDKNPTLWATSFAWRTPITSMQSKEQGISN
jgi:hypothetical protein